MTAIWFERFSWWMKSLRHISVLRIKLEIFLHSCEQRDISSSLFWAGNWDYLLQFEGDCWKLWYEIWDVIWYGVVGLILLWLLLSFSYLVSSLYILYLPLHNQTSLFPASSLLYFVNRCNYHTLILYTLGFCIMKTLEKFLGISPRYLKHCT